MESHSPRFERTLAWLCAPSLAGIKPADLISYCPQPGEAAAYTRGLGASGWSIT